MSRREDRPWLLHMLEAAEKALEFAQGKSRADLQNDQMLAFALIRCLEIIGEAATHLSADAKSRIDRIPWPQVVGMRNRLIHAYFDVDLDRVWDTLSEDLPPLIAALRAAIPETD